MAPRMEWLKFHCDFTSSHFVAPQHFSSRQFVTFNRRAPSMSSLFWQPLFFEELSAPNSWKETNLVKSDYHLSQSQHCKGSVTCRFSITLRSTDNLLLAETPQWKQSGQNIKSHIWWSAGRVCLTVKALLVVSAKGEHDQTIPIYCRIDYD